jgi:uncharacterized protein YjbI with pentapeptide repeats
MWLTAVVIAVLTAAVVVVLWWAATRGLNGAELVTARLDALKIGLSIGVGSGGVVALYLSWRRQDSTERTLAHQQDVHTATMAHQDRVASATEHDASQRRQNELYVKAVEQLGSAEAAVRHGGLYALEQVAQDDPKRQQTVVNVICAYLRGPYTPPSDTAGPRPLGVRRPLMKSTGPRTPATPPTSIARETQLQEREVRLTAQRILHQHLQPGPAPDHPRPEFWPDIDIDLTGATLTDFSLDYCRIGNASFRSTTFTDDAYFDGAEIGGEALFRGTKFGGEALFRDAVFDGDARFEEAKFGGGACFGEAEFHGDTRFNGAEFEGEARFSDARFYRAEFGSDARFSRAEFAGDAWFSRAEFGSDARFRNAKFGRDAQFDRVEFGGVAEFNRAEFRGVLAFGGAEFGGEATFEEAVYDGRVFDPVEHGVLQRADEPGSAEGPDPT